MKKQRIKELEQIITELDTSFELGEDCVNPLTKEIVLDNEYDALKKELFDLCPESKIFSNITASKVKTTKDGNFRSPEQITKDETMKAVAIHMASLAGRITLENQVEAINVAYETYYRNTTKER